MTVNDERENDLEILVNSDFSNDFSKINFGRPRVDTGMRKLIEELHINAQLINNYPHNDSVNYKNTQAIRFAAPKETMQMADYVDMKTLESVFNELVPFVKVRKQKGVYHLVVLDEKTQLAYGNPLIQGHWQYKTPHYPVQL